MYAADRAPTVPNPSRLIGATYLAGPLYSGAGHVAMHYLIDEAGRPLVRINTLTARRRELLVLIRRHLPPRIS